MLFSSAMVRVMAHLPGSLSCCGDFLFLAKNKHINTLLFSFVGRPGHLCIDTYMKNEKFITTV